MVDGLTPDIMHDVLEGAVQVQVNLLLRELIAQGFLSLKVLNSRIVSFCYGPVDTVNKPTPLSDKVLASSDTLLKQSGMCLLFY